MSSEVASTKHTHYAYAFLILCVAVEFTSIGLGISFNLDQDEANTSLSEAVYILTAVGVAGQLLSCFLVTFLTRVTSKNTKQERFGEMLTYGIGAMSIPSLGPIQLAATIVMAVSLAKNDDVDVQAYASVIVGLNFVSILLAVAFGVFFYMPVNQDKDTNELPK